MPNQPPPSDAPPPFQAPAKTNRGWPRLACYFPLISIGLEVAWCVLLFLAVLFIVGDAPYTNTDAKSRFFDLLASLPVVIGFIVGLIALTQKWPAQPLEWICLIIGIFLCAFWTAGFAWGLVN